MAERPKFGEKLPQVNRRGKQTPAAVMFSEEELPIFSGTPMPATEKPYVPEDRSMKQLLLPMTPAINYEAVLKRDKQLYKRRRGAELPAAATLFQASPETDGPSEDAMETPNPLHELLRPYLDLVTLRRLAA